MREIDAIRLEQERHQAWRAKASTWQRLKTDVSCWVILHLPTLWLAYARVRRWFEE